MEILTILLRCTLNSNRYGFCYCIISANSLSTQIKHKEKMKFFAEVEKAVGRLGALRQSFAWGALQLFNGSGSPNFPFNQPIKIANVSPFFFVFASLFLFDLFKVCRSKGDLNSFVGKINDERELRVRIFI